MKKELRPFHDMVACEVCGRTILKGERTEAYLAPGGERHAVCSLCFVRAEQVGWIRESAHDQLPTRGPRPPERRPLFGRLRRRPSELGGAEPLGTRQRAVDPAGHEDAETVPVSNGDLATGDARRRQPPKNPRQVRAVPTTAEVKVERALELFNSSEHQRTVSGLTRSLGPPWATAVPDPDAPSTVTVVIAWELSWYRYRIDLGDSVEPLALQEKGDELGDIPESLRAWNAALDANGRLVVEVAQR